MKQLILVAMLAMAVARVDAAVIDKDKELTSAQVDAIVKDGVTVVQGKPPFSIKHPKLHKVGRKIRKTCTVLSPVIGVCGSCAQVISTFKR